jgi:hypothetical protein
LTDPAVLAATELVRLAAKHIPRLRAEEVAAETSPVGQTDLGLEEALSLGRGLSKRDLRKEADEAEHDRSERFRDHFEWIAIRALYAGALIWTPRKTLAFEEQI